MADTISDARVHAAQAAERTAGADGGAGGAAVRVDRGTLEGHAGGGRGGRAKRSGSFASAKARRKYWIILAVCVVLAVVSVSYTHLTLPTKVL